MKSRQIVKDSLILFSYLWFLSNAPTAHRNMTWHLGTGDERFVEAAVASPPLNRRVVCSIHGHWLNRRGPIWEECSPQSARQET